VNPSAVGTGAAAQPDDALARLAGLIVDVADYPQPGILFKDITPLLADGDAFGTAIDRMVDVARRHGPVDAVAGIESRGFVIGAPVALGLGVGFVPVRKHGKLPRQALSQAYALEYGTAELDIHVDAVEPGQRVLVVDDVLATGGTMAATIALIERAGAQVAGVSVLLEIGFLDGRKRLRPHDVFALLAA
jgi:adenine phosphoribosyltransferase